jgi:hypothetical protein
MATLDALLKLAADCYAHARLSSNPLTKTELTFMGDDYLKQAEELQRGRAVTQAVFPKRDRNRLMATHGKKHHSGAKSAS